MKLLNSLFVLSGLGILAIGLAQQKPFRRDPLTSLQMPKATKTKDTIAIYRAMDAPDKHPEFWGWVREPWKGEDKAYDALCAKIELEWTGKQRQATKKYRDLLLQSPENRRVLFLYAHALAFQFKDEERRIGMDELGELTEECARVFFKLAKISLPMTKDEVRTRYLFCIFTHQFIRNGIYDFGNLGEHLLRECDDKVNLLVSLIKQYMLVPEKREALIIHSRNLIKEVPNNGYGYSSMGLVYRMTALRSEKGKLIGISRNDMKQAIYWYELGNKKTNQESDKIFFRERLDECRKLMKQFP